jgi:serine/threonine-protein phosphatase 2A regulatory subunit B''
MAAAIKMDELLVHWLANDNVYETVLEWIEQYKTDDAAEASNEEGYNVGGGSGVTEMNNKNSNATTTAAIGDAHGNELTEKDSDDGTETTTTAGMTTTDAAGNEIPPFYPTRNKLHRILKSTPPAPTSTMDTWEPNQDAIAAATAAAAAAVAASNSNDMDEMSRETLDGGELLSQPALCARDAALQIFHELGTKNPQLTATSTTANGTTTSSSTTTSIHQQNATKDDADRQMILHPDAFVRVTKDVCKFPSYFNVPFYQRICDVWNQAFQRSETIVTFEMLEYYWTQYMENYDSVDRFFLLVKQLDANCEFIVRDDFLPFLKALLADHPGLEFLSSHAEFQEKYAVTVITRIFYSVNRCHSGKISTRQIRHSDLLSAFYQVDEEEDINKVTRYFSYEHFYVLYCRFWELDHDRDFRITRDDLLKYGDHSLSHMVVDRVFDAAPRPFAQENMSTDYLSYEDFIYFMLSEEDKSNEVSVWYWFSCVDVDGDNKLNNMEMRSFYAVQLHRMQCMGHEIVPFEDMLCQMMDMIKPAHAEYLEVSDFLKVECAPVAGALFDALFNLNKYLLFEQRDPFVERQKREDDFHCDWDRFACIDYNRLAMEEEAREEEAMEIDWVNVDEDDDEQQQQQLQPQGGGTNDGRF